MNRERLVFSIGILRHFINDSLGLKKPDCSVTGFELNEALLDAAAYNAYLETVSGKTDTLYLRIKNGITSMTTYAYLEYIKRLSEKFGWKERNFILAFDYTDEDFYGEVDRFSIHGWTGKDGITGKFKFLTCSIVSDEIPEKIPLISIPILLGHYKSKAVLYCLDRIRQYIGNILLILFDRGFYDKDLMYELSKNGYPYLIFVPKSIDKQQILREMEEGQQKVFIHDFTVNKDNTKHEGKTYLSFFKQICNPNSEKSYDWVFATNVEDVALSNTIEAYKSRWNIETGYRVQDEAKIKCKSKEMRIRYFLFAYQQMLQTQWVCFYKNEVSFKGFLIEMHNTCKDIVANPKKTFGKPRMLKSVGD
jgi:hypothetical protein